MDTLSPELKQHILKFCGINEWMNLAETSKEMRNVLSAKVFLDDVCRRRFGLVFDELPELTDYEKLFIDTQQIWQILLQAEADGRANPKFIDVHPSLAKIYAMELRSSWYPYLFNGSSVNVSPNIVLRDLKNPWNSWWPYDDQSINQSPFFAETKKFSARIHAAFPDLFESLVNSTWREDRRGIFGYIMGNYPAEMRAILAAEKINFWLDERQPKVIQIITPLNQALYFFIYEDDNMFRVIYNSTAVIGITGDRVSSGFIPCKASLEGIRGTIGDMIWDFCNLEFGMVEESIQCPRMGPLETTQADMHSVQQHFVKTLDAAIKTSASDLVESLVDREPDEQRRDQWFQMLIKLVDNLYPCVSLMHRYCDEGKRPSKRLSIAYCRALRRLVNHVFMEEVKKIHEIPLTRQLVHAWSFHGCGRNHQLCYDFNAPSNFDFKGECFMKEAVSNLMCGHRGFVDLWPATTLKKAIDQMPQLAIQVKLDSVELE